MLLFMFLFMFLLLAGIFLIIKFSVIISVKGVALIIKMCFSLIGVVLIFAGGILGAVIGMIILIGCGIHMLAKA